MVRSAIVTGSSRGIGKAIALRLASDGYDVCINDIAANKAGCEEVASEIKAMGRKSLVHIADVSKRSEVTEMIAASVAALGPLHTMVANAGIAQVKPLLEITEADMERMFQVNVYGVHNCYVEAAKQMIAQGPLPPVNFEALQATDKNQAGIYKIIGAASIAAYRPFPLLSHYAASKYAVKGLTHGFALEMAVHKITVNAYAPGIVGTAMWDLIDEEMGKLSGVEKGSTIKKYSQELIALKRTSVPADVARSVGYLASGDSDYMTGQTHIIDGGIVFD